MPCCGMCGSHSDYDDYDDHDNDNDNDNATAVDPHSERRPLLAADEATDRQRGLHAKLHAYQMARALADGYLPSTQQAAAQLTSGVAAVSDLLDTRTVRRGGRLSRGGRHLLQQTATWLARLRDLLEHKNGRDQLQEVVWWARKCGGGGSMTAVVEGSVQVAVQTSPSAGWTSLQTIAALLLESTPFRLLLADVADVGRDVFRETAAATAEAADAAAHNVGSSSSTETGPEPPPAGETLTEMADEIASGAKKVAAEAQASIGAKLADNDDNNNDNDNNEARTRLASRLRTVVASLSQKPDYAQSVSMLTRVLQRGAGVYLKSVAEVADAVQEDVEQNHDADQALHDFWTFLTSFGDAREWKALEEKLQAILDKVGAGSATAATTATTKERDANIDRFVQHAAAAVEQALTDPALYRDDDVLSALQSRLVAAADAADGLEEDFEGLTRQAKTTLDAVLADSDVHGLVDATVDLVDVFWPNNNNNNSSSSYTTTDLAGDAAAVFVPTLLQAVRYVPIPRVEVLTPQIDLLLEPVVVEPATPHDSLLPDHVRVELHNSVDIGLPQADDSSSPDSSLGTTATVTVQGLALQAQDVGYVARLHAGLLRFVDSGIASVSVSGVDVSLDLAIVRDKAERVVALRRVHVAVGRLDYRIGGGRTSTSPMSCVAWLLQPMLRPLLRKTLEKQAAATIQDLFATANTELVMARERLRGARAAGGTQTNTLQSLPGLVRAVLARFPEPADTDTHVSVGVAAPASDSPFAGVYAPGSLVRVWRDEAEAAKERVDDAAARGWRNAIFDSC